MWYNKCNRNDSPYIVSINIKERRAIMTDSIMDAIKEQSERIELKKLGEQIFELSIIALNNNYILFKSNDDLSSNITDFVAKLNKELSSNLKSSIHPYVFDMTTNALEHKYIKFDDSTVDAAEAISKFIIDLNSKLKEN